MRSNVLLVILDTARAKSCSLYGRDRPTIPGLERIAEESAVFEHAVAPDTWTVPSHAAMFTGRYPTEIGVHARNMVLSEEEPTIAEDLAGAGYATGIFSSNPFLTQGSGLNRGFDRSHTSKLRLTLFDDAFDPARYIRTREYERGLPRVAELARELAGPPHEIAKNALNAAYYKYRTSRSDEDPSFDPTSDDGAAESIAAFESWVDDVGEPFFGCLNFMETHTPYRHRDRFLPTWATIEDVRRLDQDRWKYLAGDLELTERRKKLFEALYEAELRSLDERLQSLWSALRERGLWEDTLIVVTSDHGELLGEHGLLFHDMNRLHEPLLHVPLLVKYPGGRHAGTSVAATTSLTRLRDIVRDETVDDGASDPGDLPQDLVKAEFVGMNQVMPDDRYASTYSDLAAQSRAVYEDGTKYVLYEDRATVTRDVPLTPSAGEENAEPVDPEAVPERVREFAALDEAVTAERQLQVDDAVGDRLAELGYR
jgi:arylsulfatase A-like enzyme